MIPTPQVMLDYLRVAAEHDKDKTAFVFLRDGQTDRQSLSYGALFDGCLSVAAALREHAEPGSRVLILAAPGLEAVLALYGCFAAGVVAVPVIAPHPSRLKVQSGRLLSIVRDCAPSAILTTASIQDTADEYASLNWEFAVPAWLAVDTASAPRAALPAPAAISGDDLALLQYTSGSTASPKGVMLSHANIVANQRVISSLAGPEPDHVFGTWLPHYHDMGLSFLLQPVFRAATGVLMSPMHFLQKPMRWIRMLASEGCTVTSAPNFAFERAVEGARNEDLSQIDLHRLRRIGAGSEVVRPSVLRRFLQTFAPCGLSQKALCPGYGLAEATMLVTYTRSGFDLTAATFDDAALARGKVELCDADHGGIGREPAVHAVELCGNGFIADEHCIAIVRPDSNHLAGPDEVGEIWLSGPSVGSGYWGNDILSAGTFRAELNPPDGRRYLRTGDLGFLIGDELFVAGRMKDMIIVRGRNIYPSDIEELVERLDERILASVAFEVPDSSGDGAVGIVLEMRRGARDRLEDLLSEIRRKIASGFDVEVVAAIAVRQYGLPRTTSGKIQRNQCRLQYLAGELTCLTAVAQGERAENV